jgi:hypothetical protein
MASTYSMSLAETERRRQSHLVVGHLGMYLFLTLSGKSFLKHHTVRICADELRFYVRVQTTPTTTTQTKLVLYSRYP